MYIGMNPVKAQLATEAEAWPWSSAPRIARFEYRHASVGPIRAENGIRFAWDLVLRIGGWQK